MIPAAIAIGIPARDEALRIEACLASIGAAVAPCRLPVSVVVAADCCRDQTLQLAERALAAASPVLRGHVIEVGAATAGGAREAACAAAVAATGRPVSEVWLATTDADSTVAPDWLIAQLRWAWRGLHGVAGLVHIDGELPVEIRRRARASQRRNGRGVGHRHVHGANLGLRGELWQQLGGFLPLPLGEDQQLWAAARVRAPRCWASTTSSSPPAAGG